MGSELECSVYETPLYYQTSNKTKHKQGINKYNSAEVWVHLQMTSCKQRARAGVRLFVTERHKVEGLVHDR